MVRPSVWDVVAQVVHWSTGPPGLVGCRLFIQVDQQAAGRAAQSHGNSVS